MLCLIKNEEDGRHKQIGLKRGDVFNDSRRTGGVNAQNENAVSAVAAAAVSKISSTASFTSFYDKISTGWFKN